MTESHTQERINKQQFKKPFPKYESPFKDAPPIPERYIQHRRYGGSINEFDLYTGYKKTMVKIANDITHDESFDKTCKKNIELREAGVDLSKLKKNKVYLSIEQLLSDEKSGGV